MNSVMNSVMNRKSVYTLTSSQKMMIFVLSMSLYGLSNMFTELIPSLQLGPIELSVEYFAFIPLTLCMLFHPFYAAIGAALGEVIFGELMLGQFGGLGEIEKFLTFSFAMYVAGRLVRNPQNRAQVGIAAITGVIIHQLCSSLVDIGKVWIGVEEFEAVPGLAQSVVIVEGVSFLNDVLFSGILFALLPTLYLVPRLYGKIEPLLGIKPRKKDTQYEAAGIISPKLVLTGILLALLAFGAESLSETDWNFGEWDSGWADQAGNTAIWLSLGIAAVIAAIVLLLMRSRKMRQGNTDAGVDTGASAGAGTGTGAKAGGGGMPHA